eukprot:125071-Prymnesium_polylepis.3
MECMGIILTLDSSEASVPSTNVLASGTASAGAPASEDEAAGGAQPMPRHSMALQRTLSLQDLAQHERLLDGDKRKDLWGKPQTEDRLAAQAMELQATLLAVGMGHVPVRTAESGGVEKRRASRWTYVEAASLRDSARDSSCDSARDPTPTWSRDSSPMPNLNSNPSPLRSSETKAMAAKVEEELRYLYERAPPVGVTLVLTASCSDAARFADAHPLLFREKTLCVIHMGGAQLVSATADLQMRGTQLDEEDAKITGGTML